VSTEAPKFLTESAEATMNVMGGQFINFLLQILTFLSFIDVKYDFPVALPRDAPRVTGLADVYNEGEPISLNCTSARSKPAAALAWFINGNQVNKTQRYKVC
jgi:hypothetical protein